MTEHNRAAGSPLRYRNFRLLLAAMIVDTFGNAVMRVVLPFAVFAVVGVTATSTADELALAAKAAGAVGAAQIIGLMLVTLFGGTMADRWPRAVILVWSNVAAAVVDGVLAWALLSGRASIPVVVALSFAGGAVAAVSHPASMALVRDTVPYELLQRANAISTSGRRIVRVSSYLVGGVISVTWGPAWGITINAVTFLAAALLFAAVDVPRRIREASRMIDDLREGIATFWRLRWARMTVLSFTAMNACFSAGLLVLGPLVAIKTFGEAAWGWVLGAESFGLIVISIVLCLSGRCKICASNAQLLHVYRHI
jgi:MFS family permease